MSDFAVAHHEAGHAVAAAAFGAPIKLLSIRPNESEAGRTRLDNPDVDDIQAAVIFVAGRLAEQKALGRPPSFDWFAGVGEEREDTDDANARWFADRIAAAGGYEGDVREVRHLIELKARSLLATRWEAVEEIAAKLTREKVLTGQEVERICRDHRVKRYGPRVISHEEAWKKIAEKSPRGAMIVNGWKRDSLERR